MVLMKSAALLLLGSLVLAPTPILAQSVTVAVDITDPTGGSITGSLTGALQALGDVGVLSEAERPRYVLTGVVICQPDSDACEEATSYIMALALVEPLNPVVLSDLAFAADSSHRIPASAYSPEVWDLTAEYMKVHRLSATNVGRGVYERAIQGFIASLNARCFEKARVLKRWSTAREQGWSEGAAAFSETLDSGDWIC
jgi:hypothetical protein